MRRSLKESENGGQRSRWIVFAPVPCKMASNRRSFEYTSGRVVMQFGQARSMASSTRESRRLDLFHATRSQGKRIWMLRMGEKDFTEFCDVLKGHLMTKHDEVPRSQRLIANNFQSLVFIQAIW